jgi:hypothetical protein
MFSRRLHPTPSTLAFGLAVIAFWALIWIWFFAQLSRPHPVLAHAVAVARLQPSARDARDPRALRPLAPRSSRNAVSIVGGVSSSSRA